MQRGSVSTVYTLPDTNTTCIERKRIASFYLPPPETHTRVTRLGEEARELNGSLIPLIGWGVCRHCRTGFVHSPARVCSFRLGCEKGENLEAAETQGEAKSAYR